MTSKKTHNSKQMTSGKAFEYALLLQFNEKLCEKTAIKIIQNSSFLIAQSCFESLSNLEKSDFILKSSFAVNFLVDLEPRLSNDIGKDDILELEIVSDYEGKLGDVRDVLAIRSLQKWEIGVSAKNNHRAVKHSRLSASIDFGEKWFGVPVSQDYFKKINPVFESLDQIKKESQGKKKWKDLEDHHSNIYEPVLKAFVDEMKNLDNKHKNIAMNLVAYLIGVKDFYKVIKGKQSVEIQAYNLHGNLSLPFQAIEPKYKIQKVSLPTKIIDVSFKKNSKTTVIVEMDQDWTLSFRIHSASSRVESSLKFDIQLLKSPKKLFKNILHIS